MPISLNQRRQDVSRVLAPCSMVEGCEELLLLYIFALQWDECLADLHKGSFRASYRICPSVSPSALKPRNARNRSRMLP
jgi:hypothetical protein